MTTATARKENSRVVSALHARSSFGALLRRIDGENKSMVIEKRGAPMAVLMNIRDYVKLAAPEPEILKIIGDEARANGTSELSTAQINRIIKAARSEKKKH